MVERAVARDPVQPGTDVDLALVGEHRVERGREHLLEHVLGVLARAQHVPAERQQPRLVAGEQHLERGVLPAAGHARSDARPTAGAAEAEGPLRPGIDLCVSAETSTASSAPSSACICPSITPQQPQSCVNARAAVPAGGTIGSARVDKLAKSADLKSAARTSLRVRLPSRVSRVWLSGAETGACGGSTRRDRGPDAGESGRFQNGSHPRRSAGMSHVSRALSDDTRALPRTPSWRSRSGHSVSAPIAPGALRPVDRVARRWRPKRAQRKAPRRSTAGG